MTGAAGFVGSHLVEQLVDCGAVVRCFVRYTSKPKFGCLEDLPPAKRKSIEVVAGDLRDAEAVCGATKGVDTVFHLGALIGIPYSYEHPREVIETNVMGTFNVLMSARRRGVRRVVYASSSEVYGTASYVPIDEKHPLQAQSPYSASKIGAEKLVESFHTSFGLPAITLRPFNIFGPRQSARAIIPTIITQLLVDGTVRLGNISATRDFTFVADTVSAFLKAATVDSAVGGTFNVGSNSEISVADLTKKIAHLAGRDYRINLQEQRLRPARSEVNRLRADSTLATSLLGWSPQISLNAGLTCTLSWIENNLDRYRTGHYEI